MSGEQTGGRSYMDLEGRMEHLVELLEKPEMGHACNSELKNLSTIVDQILGLDQPDLKNVVGQLRPKSIVALDELEKCLKGQGRETMGDWALTLQELRYAIDNS